MYRYANEIAVKTLGIVLLLVFYSFELIKKMLRYVKDA